MKTRYSLFALLLGCTALPAMAEEVNIYSHRQPELISPCWMPLPPRPALMSTWPLSTRVWSNGWWPRATAAPLIWC